MNAGEQKGELEGQMRPESRVLLQECLPWGEPLAGTRILAAFDGFIGVFEFKAVENVVGKGLGRGKIGR